MSTEPSKPDSAPDRPAEHNVERREFVASVLGAAAALALSRNASALETIESHITSGAATAASTMDVTLRVNGTAQSLTLDPRVSLLDALRERLALTGTRKGCDHGQCGACTVLRDGHAINACRTLAVTAEGSEITTIEGLARGDKLHPVQAAFIEHDAFQCGFCTSGQIMSAVALLREGRAKTDDEVRQKMSGNICRCGAYPNIVAAIQAARKEV